MKILVCDDLPDRCDEVKKAIEHAKLDGAEVDTLVGKELVAQLELLFAKVEACLKAPTGYVESLDLKFDGYDLIAIDNNLAHLEIKGARLTAESIAGYIRAFTSAPYVVSLNKNPDVDFDLRY